MAYTGKKPTDFVDVTQTKDFTVTEDLTVDTDTLVVDSTNNRVGIGTSSPTAPLMVNGGGTNFPIVVNSTDQYAGIAFADNTTTTNAHVAVYADGNALGFEAGNSERMRIDSSGNVIIGKSTFDSSIAGVMFDTRAFVTTSNAATTILNRLTSDGDIAVFRKNGTTVGSIGVDYSSRLYIGTGDTGLFFNDLSNAVQPISPAGDLRGNAIDLGTAGTTFKDLYLGGGVYVGGTGSANKLDDYEEGTWTPSFEMVSGSATFTYQGRAGYYTKVGRLVTVHFAVHSSGVTVTTDGKVRIGGLPFTSSNANGLLRSYSVGFKQLIDTAEVGILYAINNNSNFIEMYEGHTTYPESNRLIDASILTNDRRVRGVLQYLV